MAKMKIDQIDDFNCLVDSDIIKLSLMGGCRRKGFYKDYIIKFESDTDDYEIDNQNYREIEIWKSMDKKDRKYFPKLIQYSYKDNYIVQERIKFKRGRKPAKFYDMIHDLVMKYEIHDIGFSGENDNWGIRADTGEPVIFDYGYHVPEKDYGEN